MDNGFELCRRGQRIPTALLPVSLVPKLDDEDASSGAVLGDFEQIDETGKSGGARQVGCDVRQRRFEDLGDDDLARGQRVAPADFHVRSLPEPDGGRDLAPPNAIAEWSEELHASRR